MLLSQLPEPNLNLFPPEDLLESHPFRIIKLHSRHFNQKVWTPDGWYNINYKFFYLTHDTHFYFQFPAKAILQNYTEFEELVTKAESERNTCIFRNHLNLFIYSKTKLKLKFKMMQCFFRNEVLFTEWIYFYRMKFFKGNANIFLEIIFFFFFLKKVFFWENT